MRSEPQRAFKFFRGGSTLKVEFDFREHRALLIAVGLLIVSGLTFAPFLSASCSTRQQMTTGEQKALDTLRNMTRGGVLPAEDAVARIESDYPNSRAAALARLVRARIHLKANDFTGAAALLDSNIYATQTSIADYALFLWANALQQSPRFAEAHTAYEQLARQYPDSLRGRDAVLQDAAMYVNQGQVNAVPALLKDLSAKNDAAALQLTAKAYEQTGDQARAVAAYRRLYFYAPTSYPPVGETAQMAISRLGSNTTPATAEEALARADKFYAAARYAEAAAAYADAFTRFPNSFNAPVQLRRGIAAANAKRTNDAVAALSAIPTSANERAQALYYLAQAYAQSHQWEQARTTLDEMRRAYPQNNLTARAIVNAGQIARDAKNTVEASNYFRTAVTAFPNTAEVAQAQFEIAWASHEAKNYPESSRLLTEHLAYYADKNTDNRGRAGYWAARDSERAGKIAEARAIYQAMQARYDANWYGYLSKQRLDAIAKSAGAAQTNFAPDSPVGRAVQNLQTVTVAEETAGPREATHITKADQLSNVGLDDWALDELNAASEAAPSSPQVNLALARLYRAREDNLHALNSLKRSFPDYSQMKPEELTREEWDVFYPLAYWDIILQESRAKRLDPYQVAGLIRQETIFDPHAHSHADAYGLMQLLIPTAQVLARQNGIDRTITPDALYEPRLNIQLGTAYLRNQIDKFGRIEYVAAAYNAGPNRVVQWRVSLPPEIDEWAEAVPFKETRGYVQGVVRNRLQYERLYDENGNFRPEVGTRAARPGLNNNAAPAVQPANSTIRQRRVGGNEQEE